MSYVVTGTRFRAPRTREFFSRIDFFCQGGSNEVSYTPVRVREAGFPPQAGTQLGETLWR